MVQAILPNVYSIPIRLVGNPLKSLNSYIIKGKQRNLIIDTGLNQKECLEDLYNGIRELDLDMNVTDLFLTHFHADHTGLATTIASQDTKIFMGEKDLSFHNAELDEKSTYRDALNKGVLKTGFPPDDYYNAIQATPGARFASPKKIQCGVPIQDGDIISVDGMELKCILTPGHTPGHICLYNGKNKVMFLGDHVLFDITPNIITRPGVVNPLKEYLESLENCKRYDVEIALPAHRKSGVSLKKRIDELIQHHKNRLQEVINIIRSSPGISGYDIAARMRWSIRAKNWAAFPAAQKWFAVGEASAHLNYLAAEGKIHCDDSGGINRYTVI